MKTTIFYRKRSGHRLLLLTIGLVCIFNLSSCQNNSLHHPKPSWFKYYHVYDAHEQQAYYRQAIPQHSDPDSNIQYGLQYFYGQRDYEPFWTGKGLDEAMSGTLLTYLAELTQHGINPKQLEYDHIQRSIDSLKNHLVENRDSTLYQQLLDLELTLTKSYLRYMTTMRYGISDPKTVNGGKWLYKYEKPDTAFVQEALAQMEHLEKTLQQVQIEDPVYRRHQEELARWYRKAEQTPDTLAQGTWYKRSEDSRFRTLCQRLKWMGVLDSATADTNRLTPKVLKAVNLFRADNAIPTSDTLDRETISKLNRPASYYINRLSANMERLRWHVTPAKDRTYIAVNIPDFTLCTFVEDTIAFQTRICCGRTADPAKASWRKKTNGLILAAKSESPLLYSKINYIVLNPEWNIPYDIIKNEYYQKLCRSNTAVVNKEHLYIKDARNGQYVKPETIDWTKVNRQNIPYRLYQTSGRYNALGQIKFSFPNTESVYLHDTNNKGAFKRRVRALSHGCIRVENPFELAEVLYDLNEFDTIRKEQIDIIMGKEPTTEKGEKYLEKLEEQDSIRYEKLSDYDKQFYRKLMPTSIHLKKQMPLYIEYYTCFLDDKGRMQYRNDIYYKDDNILIFTGMER
ncbi:MAG: L,D-transpeptidase family protein [Bacteroidales bacterium]|nr:L,D-transpeptidase family protein [Bacteroidales bacterium]